MRLYLSSYGFGNQPQKLVELVGNNKRVAVITNAGDYHTPAEQQERFEYDIEQFTQLGLKPEALDLREYLGDEHRLAKRLQQYGLVWLRGGNSFILMRAINASGFDKIIKALLVKDQVVYGGFSAGACVASANLHGIDIVDDPNLVPAGYETEIPWQGLGLIDYAIAPHYQSDHPESVDIDQTVAYFQEHELPFKTLRDGEVIIIQGDNEELIT